MSQLDDTEAFLAHYGIKGMRWGVRREDSTGFGSSSLTPERAANLQKNKEKFKAKLDSSEAAPGESSPRLTPEQKKKLIYAALGTVAVAGVLTSAYYINKNGAELPSFEPPPASAKPKSGLDGYLAGVKKSTDKVWGDDNFVTPGSYAREEFTLPAGHMFHRLSNSSETTFKNGGTYTASSNADFARYVAGFRRELPNEDYHHVTFTAKSPIRVPNLKTNLDTLKEVMTAESKMVPNDDDVVKAYNALSGGSWDNPRALNLFSGLAKKGYGAIVDEMDAGVIADKPLVVFAKDQLSGKAAYPLDANAISSIEKTVTDFSDRK